MSQSTQKLAQHLNTALADAGLSVETLSERTKVPRTTILHLMDQPVSAFLPERVYLRGHLGLIARELGASVPTIEAAFDDAYPAHTPEPELPEQARYRSQSFAVTATLGGVALLSVVAAFVTALG